MSLQYVEFLKKNGNLYLKLTEDGKQELKEAIEGGKNVDSDDFFHDLIEYNLGNGWEMIAPKDIGALTSAPILSDEVERDDSVGIQQVGRVYWFPNYAKTSIVDELYHGKEVIFVGVE